MIPRFVLRFFELVHETLNRPLRILWICGIIAFVNLVLDGSLFRLWSLHRDQSQLEEKIESLQGKTEDVSMKIERASDPAFIEREARDRLDLVGEEDLVFVFSDN